MDSSDSPSKSTFKCDICETTFSRLHNFKKHERIIHGITAGLKRQPTHEIHTFYSDHDFLEWKAKLEEETRSSYVKKSGIKRLSNQETVQYFHCHRSGVFTPRNQQNRKRQLKRSGSIKIGCNCPAKMVVHTRTIDCASEITVKFTPTHANHEIEPARLTLSRHEKSYLAEQLAIGLPKSQVLKNLEHTFDSSTRLSLVTRKDLHNISNSFKIEVNLCIHPDDARSVDARVVKLQLDSAANHDNPLLLYKRYDELSAEMEEFERKDFVLAIMNEAQANLLALHGNRIVQIDSTPATNDYAYMLTAVLVTDLNGEALPVAILYASCQTAVVYQRFFAAVRNKLMSRHETVAPHVLITDDTPPVGDAWRLVFGSPNVQLVCEWHVKRAFKRHLNSKIPSPKLRATVAKELEALNAELDERVFDELLRTLCRKWSDEPCSRLFADYFVENYAGRPQQWARCYRQNVGVNTNTKIERWRKELVRVTAPRGSPVVKRLDHSLDAVLELIEQKLSGKKVAATHLPKAKQSATVAAQQQQQQQHEQQQQQQVISQPVTTIVQTHLEMPARHADSLAMSCATIIETDPGKTWIIPTSESANTLIETNEVTKLGEICEPKCDARCELCNACAHQYACTCSDNRETLQMCKHIHKICQIYPQYSELIQIDVAAAAAAAATGQAEFQEMQIVNSDNSHHMELVQQVQQADSGAVHIELVPHVTYDSVDVRRANLITKLQMASAKVEFATTHEEIDILDQLLDAFIVNLDIWSIEQKQTG